MLRSNSNSKPHVVPVMFKWLYLPIIALAISCGGLGCARSGASKSQNDPGIGRKPAADFTLTDLQGESHSLSDYRGKVVLLNFWAPWCFSCKAEMAGLDELKRYLADEQFETLGVTVLESRERAFNPKVQFPILLDVQKTVAKLYGVEIVPVTIILDKAGRIVSFPDPDHDTSETYFTGPRGWNSLKAVRDLRRLMNE